MTQTMIALVPLLACLFGVAFMAGLAALVHRVRHRSNTAQISGRTASPVGTGGGNPK